MGGFIILPMAFCDRGLFIAYSFVMSAYCVVLAAYHLRKLVARFLTWFEFPSFAIVLEVPLWGGVEGVA